jgi:hypothetical protein
MAEKRKSREPEEGQSVQDARRHVGRTLESEGNFDQRMGRAVPIRRAGGGSEGNETDNLEVRRVPPDAEEGNAADAADAGRVSSLTPPLRTRLADDASSDPHTDVGPDDANTAQKRPERKGRNAA